MGGGSPLGCRPAAALWLKVCRCFYRVPCLGMMVNSSVWVTGEEFHFCISVVTGAQGFLLCFSGCVGNGRGGVRSYGIGEDMMKSEMVQNGYSSSQSITEKTFLSFYLPVSSEMLMAPLCL